MPNPIIDTRWQNNKGDILKVIEYWHWVNGNQIRMKNERTGAVTELIFVSEFNKAFADGKLKYAPDEK